MANPDTRFQNLEEYLQNEARITLGDRVRNVLANVRGNAEAFIPLGFALGFSGVIACNVVALVDHVAATKPYQLAYDYVAALSAIADQAAALGKALPVSPEVRHIHEQLVQQGIQSGVYVDEAQRILAQVRGETPNLSVYLTGLKEVLRSLAESGKETALILSSIFGSCFGAVWLVFGSKTAVENMYYSNTLDDKKWLRKELPKKLSDLRAELEIHPFADQIYDFLDAVKGRVSTRKLVGHAEFLVTYRRESDVWVFDALTMSPMAYIQPYSIADAFHWPRQEERPKAPPAVVPLPM